MTEDWTKLRNEELLSFVGCLFTNYYWDDEMVRHVAHMAGMTTVTEF
jgi:hypothetical protein